MQKTSVEYKTIHGWTENVTHRESCKKFGFDLTTKWYMQNPESILDYEMHKIHRDFKIQTDHWILVRKLDQVLIGKKNEMLKILWEFKIQSDRRIHARKLDQVLINRHKMRMPKILWDFKIQTDHWILVRRLVQVTGKNEMLKIPWYFKIQSDRQIHARKLGQVLTNRHKMKCIKFSGILRYKQIIES